MREERDFEITFPPVRSVRRAEYVPAVAGAFLNGRSWADDFPELVDVAAGDPGFRRAVVGRMRNAMWSIRNHRNRGVPFVLDAVREYAADERLLELAGVHPLLLAMFCAFQLCRCNCNGACAFCEIDLGDVESARVLCDHVSLSARQIIDGELHSHDFILGVLLGQGGRNGPSS